MNAKQPRGARRRPGRGRPTLRFFASLLVLLMGGLAILTTSLAAVSAPNAIAQPSASGLSSQTKKCEKKFAGKSKKQRK
jgi:hypothetical protein